MDCSSSQPVEPSGRLPRPTFSAEQEAAIFRAAGQRVTAAVRGQRAESCRRLLGQTADTPVYGAFVSLKRAGRLRSCCGHIESTVPLWRALDSAADRAATDDPRFPRIVTAELDQLDMDVWILWGPEPVLARGEDRVQAITIGKHGVQIGRGAARGLLLPGVAVDHGLDARGAVGTGVHQGWPAPRGLARRQHATADFRGGCDSGRLVPEETDARQPAVAGGFYPGDARGVARMVDQLFAASAGRPPPSRGRARWCLMPAGSIRAVWRRPCSAAWRFRRGRSFFVPGIGRWAPSGRWRRTADGSFPAASWPPTRNWLPGWPMRSMGSCWMPPLTARNTPSRCSCPCWPTLPRRSGWWGLAWATARCRNCCGSADQLAEALREMPDRPLLIISSDMNHFANDSETRRVDRLALDAIATLDPAQRLRHGAAEPHHHVWHGPLRDRHGGLRQLQCLSRCESVGYATSAEAGGETDRVVGYAGLLFG